MGRFSVELKLANSIDAGLVRRGLLTPEQVRQVKIRGVVDTGATRLVIPAKVSEQLGAREVSETQVRYADLSACGHAQADNRTVTRKLVDDVQVELLGRQGTFRAVVEPGEIPLSSALLSSKI